jgi:hypothetical protein
MASPALVIGLCIPSLAFVAGEWLMTWIPDDRAFILILATGGLFGVVLAVVAPALTIIATGLAIAATIRIRAFSPGIMFMWGTVGISLCAVWRIAVVVDSCC